MFSQAEQQITDSLVHQIKSCCFPEWSPQASTLNDCASVCATHTSGTRQNKICGAKLADFLRCASLRLHQCLSVKHLSACWSLHVTHNSLQIFQLLTLPPKKKMNNFPKMPHSAENWLVFATVWGCERKRWLQQFLLLQLRVIRGGEWLRVHLCLRWGNQSMNDLMICWVSSASSAASFRCSCSLNSQHQPLSTWKHYSVVKKCSLSWSFLTFCHVAAANFCVFLGIGWTHSCA